MNLTVLSLANDAISADGQSAGKYMSAILIGVLSDEIHTTRCKVNFIVPSTIQLCKFLFQFGNHNIHTKNPPFFENFKFRSFLFLLCYNYSA